jgi:ketosteroid isomerase-like protein
MINDRSVHSCRRGMLLGAVLLFGACRATPVVGPGGPDSSLRRAAEAYAGSFATKSADSVIAFFDSTIVVVSPQGRMPIEGIAANRAGWERLFRGGNPSHTITLERVEAASSGELGYVTGRWAVGVDTPNGRSEARGYYLSVWRRRGAVWRQVAVSAYVLP